ncbi:MAG: DUF1206 domain-containing protein [Anaerolineae bacterium]|nr:DUF1206 domain-containing protein [Anaerolineae bacterium]
MSRVDDSLEQDAQDLLAEAQDAKDDAAPVVTRMARFGYVVDGVVYLLVGLLALDASLGARSPNVSREEALRAIVAEPLGRGLLVLIAVGLVAYAIGHLFMAARDPAKETKKGIANLVNRSAHALNGLITLSLALVAGQLGLGLGPKTSDGRTPADWTRELLALPLGQALVIGVGLGLLGLALHQIHKAITANFRNVMRLDEMSDRQEMWLTSLGRVGYAVRSIIYGLMGIFLIQASRNFNPDEARGLGQTLVAIASQEYGLYLLAAVAAGFIAFGIYVILVGRYREFNL